MLFPEDHFQHELTLEWWYFWGKIGNSFFHHVLFKNRVGREQRLYLHCSLDDEFKEYNEEEVSNYGYSTGFRMGRFFINNNYLRTTLRPCCDPVVHKDTLDEKYYSIPFLRGVDTKGRIIEAWFDHEYFNPTISKHKFSWDWISVKYLNGDYSVKATGKYSTGSKLNMKGEIIPLAEEIIFTPKFGLLYSEQPIKVVLNSKTIAYGMRERTYPRR